LDGLRWVETRGNETDLVIVGLLGHHQLELSSLIRLHIGEHGMSGSVLRECGRKLRSGHLVHSSVVLELTEHVVMLQAVAVAHRKGLTL